VTTALVFLAGVVAAILAARFLVDRAARRFHLRVRWLSKVLPGWRQIGCGRCGTSWRYARPHATTGALARGTVTMAPLCDPCWRELGSAGAREPFYAEEYRMRRAQGDTSLTPQHLTAIRAALAAGL
jgi:hypothetical protein